MNGFFGGVRGKALLCILSWFGIAELTVWANWRARPAARFGPAHLWHEAEEILKENKGECWLKKKKSLEETF